MVCPRCDGQGEIYLAEVHNLNITLYICDECDACWEAGANIEVTNFRDLSTYLVEKGTSYKDAQIEALGYQW